MRLNNYIIETTKSPLEEVRKMLKKYKNRMTKALKTSEDVEDLAVKLTEMFIGENIIFLPFNGGVKDAQYSYVASALTIPKTGTVYIELLGHKDRTKAELGFVDKKMDVREFFGQLIDILSHEFIHRAQLAKSRDPNLSMIMKDISNSNKYGDVVSYICCHYETEAWAHMAYYNLSKGITDIAETMIYYLKKNKKCYDKFLKKLYYYCRNDNEAMENLKKLTGGKY